MQIQDPQEVIAGALARNERTLNEFYSKQLISWFGVPVAREVLTSDLKSAIAASQRIGFPVALKACGHGLVHKTEMGGVALNLKSEEEIKTEGSRMLEIPKCEGLLVQEMIQGERELTAGLIRDAKFGPFVMIGLGGLMTEVMEDVVYSPVPLTLQDGVRMIEKIKAKRMLDSFRGSQPVHLESLARIVVALGEVSLRFENIQQIDVNPIKIRADGKPIAVDALVVLGDAPKDAVMATPISSVSLSRQRRPEDWRCFFEPKSVAIVGASATPNKPGYEVIRNIIANGYKGSLHLVNPKGGEICNLPVKASIEEIREDIDLTILILPAEKCTEALRDCARRRITHFVISAGGFAEVDEGRGEIQRELIKIAREEDLHILGPNTSGHISTPHQFTSTFFPLGRIRRGNISYIAQTGNFATHTMKYILTAEHFGVARVIGLGNAIDIDETDALEYLGEDPETESIILYLETIKRPKRFLEVARRVTAKKPVVMLKGGSTAAGKEAALAHTASMADEDRLVDGLLDRAGIVRIWEYSYLIHVGKALSMIRLPRGKRVSFLAPSGAMLVVLSDLCGRLGLEIPSLIAENNKRLQEISPPFLRMRNPVDIWGAASTKGIEFGYREGMEAVLRDPNIDAVVPILLLTKETGIPSYDFIIALAKRYREKPVLVSFTGDKTCISECKDYLEYHGVPTFSEIEQPFHVLSVLIKCYKAMNRKNVFFKEGLPRCR